MNGIKSLTEASEYTGYKVATLRWRRARDLPPVSRKVAGRVCYLTDDLDAWIDAELVGKVRGVTTE